jgi:hypothetical protein
MKRYGFVPYGRRNHGNVCGPCDTAELTFLRAAGAAMRQPALLLAKSPPYIRIRRGGIRPGFCSRSQPLAIIPEVGLSHRFGRLAPTLNRRGSLHELAISREAT